MTNDILDPVDDGTVVSDESLAAALSVTTDQSDYAPASTATITATGVDVGGTVNFQVDQTIDGVAVVGSAISGTGISWSIVDGGAGDGDGQANGTVVTTWNVGLDALSAAFVVTATENGETANASFTDSAPPSIHVEKKNDSTTTYIDADGSHDLSVGDTITYTYVVLNTGGTPLYDVSLVDNVLGPITLNALSGDALADLDSGGPADDLPAPFGITHGSKSVVITQAMIDAGFITNIATVTGYAPGDLTKSNPITDTDTNTVKLPTPSLNIKKTHTLYIDADSSGDISAGDTIRYTYSVHNTGTANLTNVTVSDDLLNTVTLSDAAFDGVGFLAAGATESGTLDYVIQAADLGTTITNVATADSTQAAEDTDTDHVVVGAPSLNITKTHTLYIDADSSGDISAGDTIRYTYSVHNTGTANLTNVTVSDDLLNTVTLSDAAFDGVGFLAAGATESGTLDYVIQTADLGTTITNIATVDSDQTDKDTDTNSVVVGAPAVIIEKTIDGITPGGDTGLVGDTVHYRIVIRNTGTANLTGIDVQDAFGGGPNVSLGTPLNPGAGVTIQELNGPTGDDVLSPGIPGERWVYTYDHVITQADIDGVSGLPWKDNTDIQTQTANGAIFNAGTDLPSTGTGRINSFVMLQNKGFEEGYNTNARPQQFDEKNTLQHDHAIQLQDIPVITILDQYGVAKKYLEFHLDLNESNSGDSPAITVTALKLFSGTSDSLTGMGASRLLPGGTLQYDLGTTVNLTDWSTGSGHGDYAVDIPVTNAIAALSGDTYIYLYSAFGSTGGTDPTDGGFEEWYVNKTGSILSNVATVDTDQTGPQTSSVDITADNGAIVTIHKSATVTPVGHPGTTTTVVHSVGDVINYTVTVVNPPASQADLTGVILTDSFEGGAPVTLNAGNSTLSGDVINLGTLDIGEAWHYAYSHTVTLADLNYAAAHNGLIDNIATVDTDQTHPISTLATVDPPVAVVSSTATLTTGADTVNFSLGTNTVYATATTLNATDKLTGGTDTDTLSVSGSGTFNLSTLATFTGFDNVVMNSSGETLTLRNGTDLTVTAGSGNTVNLGTSNDKVTFTSGTNTVNATAGTLNAGDSLTGGTGSDKLALTGAGTFNLALLAAFSGFETITLAASETLALRAGGAALTVTGTSGGTDALDLSNGTSGATVTTAGVTGGGFGTTNYTNIGSFTGTGFDDNITGSTAANTIHGGAGNDTVTGGGGADNIFGDAGNDVLVFASKANLDAALVVDGGLGTDTLKMSAAATLVDTDFAKIVAGSMEVLQLTGASTVTLGTAAKAAGITQVIAGAGNTTVNDTLGALTSIDASALSTSQTLTVTGGKAGQSLNINLNANFTAGADLDNLTVVGEAAANKLTTGKGADHITGGGGADVLTGGVGADTFIYKLAGDSLVAAKDTIADFAHGTDQIDLSAFGLTNQTMTTKVVGSFQTSASTNFFGSYSIVEQNSGGHSQIYVDVNGNHNFDPTLDLVINSTLQFTTGSSDFLF